MNNNTTKKAKNEDTKCVIELMVRTEVVLDGILSRFELVPTCKEQEDAVLWAKELYHQLKKTREGAGFSMEVKNGDIIVSQIAHTSNN
jgi:hypothetical protein